MLGPQGRSIQAVFTRSSAVALGAFLLVAAAACEEAVQIGPGTDPSTVRVGVGKVELQQIIQNFTVESLGRVGEDGRVAPRLAKDWTIAPDRLSLIVALRPDVSFHDGSPVTTALVAETLRRGLPNTMGPAADDILSIESISDEKIEIKLRRPSQFALEALETGIGKPGSPEIGTGAFLASSSSKGELLANDEYYLGKPTIRRVVITAYPSVRAAWAELLRDRLDMIYEVGATARDSLESSTTINLFPYTRHYQYIVLLNTRSPAIRSATVRRALNVAVDRGAFIREALDGHGLASSGPVWPQHWAAQGELPAFAFDPEESMTSVASLGAPVRFHCLVTPENERLGLVLQRQLEAVGVEMILDERAPLEAQSAVRAGDFDAFLATAISGPSILRPYDWWHSRGSRNLGKYSNTGVDAALDSIRHATSDDAYRKGLEAFQRYIVEDPPAIFLAWEERARAVSKRFEVAAEPGVDMMGTLRLWRVSTGEVPDSN